MIKNLTLPRLTILFAALFLLPLVAFTGTAKAAWSCGANYLCLYEHAGGNGSSIGYSSAFVNSCENLPSHWNDRVSSFKMGVTNYKVQFYLDANCMGASSPYFLAPYQTNMGWLNNDEVTSFKMFYKTYPF